MLHCLDGTDDFLRRRQLSVNSILHADRADTQKSFTVACIYNDDSVDRLKYAYNHGHQLASHTWAHKDLTTLSWEKSKEFMLYSLWSYTNFAI